MRAQGDIAGVVLGIVMVGAGASLLVPKWALSRDTATPSVAHVTPPKESIAAPRFHAEPAKDAPSGTVQVAGPRTTSPDWEQFAARALIPLTPDELAVLREERVDDLAALVARTERAFMEATPQTRAERERRYLAALNVAAKLATPPEPSAADARAKDVDARYRRALEREREKWRTLSPEEQARQHDAFKEAFFQKEER
ncbi:hypothetical protein A176_000171 [Myxococcus hansupus]|uniref:Uncharacterized protein n=1 Tax=Pseudomyxococcus hansupus TaxID=1297742 RepID=A0A0H4WKJ5_9BACT|nr:hypothetical protein [Myxococcus hansupus]AKQ63259.1 hypothetical protein A176_000171 [Myxococcus hansupus]